MPTELQQCVHDLRMMADSSALPDTLRFAANELERFAFYLRAIDHLKKCQFTDLRICEDIERLVEEAVKAEKGEQ